MGKVKQMIMDQEEKLDEYVWYIVSECETFDEFRKKVWDYILNNNLKKLNQNGIETRPIISGNFLNQPSIKLYKLNSKREKFPIAQEIENRGFFIGIHINPISEETLNNLEKKLLHINEI